MGRLVKRRFAARGPLAFSIDSDAVVLSQRCDLRARPRVPLGRRHPGPIEGGRNPHVGHLPGHRAHEGDDIGIHDPPMLSRTVLAHAQSRVIVANPADDEIEPSILYTHDDLFDQHADNPLARGDRRPFRMPGALDVGAKPKQRLPLVWSYPRRRRGRRARRVHPVAAALPSAARSNAAPVRQRPGDCRGRRHRIAVERA